MKRYKKFLIQGLSKIAEMHGETISKNGTIFSSNGIKHVVDIHEIINWSSNMVSVSLYIYWDQFSEEYSSFLSDMKNRYKNINTKEIRPIVILPFERLYPEIASQIYIDGDNDIDEAAEFMWRSIMLAREVRDGLRTVGGILDYLEGDQHLGAMWDYFAQATLVEHIRGRRAACEWLEGNCVNDEVEFIVYQHKYLSEKFNCTNIY